MADDQPDGQSDRLGPTEGSLRWHLQQVRDSLVATLDGLDEYDRRRPMTPSGTNLLGLVKHLAGIELEYLGLCVGRPPAVELPWVADQAIWESADMWATADESSEELIELYRGAWRHADESIEQLGLSAPATVPWWPEERRDTTLGVLLVRVVSETSQHAGHADILREMIDGRGGGDHDDVGDEQWWLDHVARVQHAADAHRPATS